MSRGLEAAVSEYANVANPSAQDARRRHRAAPVHRPAPCPDL